jgi:hypothetical protein
MESASADVAERTAAKVEESFMLLRLGAEVGTLSSLRLCRLFMLPTLMWEVEHSKVHPIVLHVDNNEQT